MNWLLFGGAFVAGLLAGVFLMALCQISGRCEDAAREFGEWDGDCG